MQELIFFIVFTVWYAGALIVSERIGKKSRLGEEWTFFIGFIFTPIVSAIAASFLKYNHQDTKTQSITKN